jgi:hypothetical protein
MEFRFRRHAGQIVAVERGYRQSRQKDDFRTDWRKRAQPCAETRAFRRLLRDEIERWGKVVKASKAKPE